jgi:hypothetical protein
MSDSRAKLGHLLEVLSLAQRWPAEDLPNPSVHAALQHGIKVLLADLKALTVDSPQSDPARKTPAAD